MDDNRLKSEIRRLLDEKNAILLAHNYQRDEIQEIADITGDSLGLSIHAANTDKDVIVFCGVHFMAESAYIIAPEKKVILPRMDAGCPMADMIDAEKLAAFKKEHPGAVVVTYVNSTAEVKALSDICCTSANAVKVVKSLTDAKKVIMVPDKNLAQYTAKFVDKEVILFDGYCPTHHDLHRDAVEKVIAEHEGALFVAHPECRPEVLELADHICSTSGMYEYVKNSTEKEFIIGTEMGILYRLKQENPDKKFYLAGKKLVCPNMKLTRLEDIYEALSDDEKFSSTNVVTVPEEIRIPAKAALDRMLAIPRD
ncbi:quinolinate synthase NadA [Thermodesulfobacteriota bacterium]